MAEEFGPGSKPDSSHAMTAARARKDEDRGEELLMAVLIGLGLRSYFAANEMSLDLRAKVVRAIVMEASASLVSTTRDLIAGKITARVWFLRMRDILSPSSLAATMAMIGRTQLNDEEIKHWVSEFNLQDGYLARFRDQLRNGEQLMNEGAIGRADLYARAIWSTANRVLGGAVADAASGGGKGIADALGVAAAQVVSFDPQYDGPVKIQARRIRSITDSCDDCVQWELLDWVDIDSDDFHEIGTSVCGSRCKCHYTYRAIPA